MIEVIQDWCKGCDICIRRCPVDALEVGKAINKKGIYPPVLVENDECNCCRLCELLCPDFAITVTPDGDETETKKDKLIIGGITGDL